LKQPLLVHHTTTRRWHSGTVPRVPDILGLAPGQGEGGFALPAQSDPNLEPIPHPGAPRFSVITGRATVLGVHGICSVPGYRWYRDLVKNFKQLAERAERLADDFQTTPKKFSQPLNVITHWEIIQ
jgi:hypothetical protein